MRETRRTPGGLGHGPAGLNGLSFSDDRGTVAAAQFMGGGSGSDSGIEWSGPLLLDPPLHPETAWIEVNGDRFELEDSAALDVRVEELPPDDPAFGFLWHRLATPGHHGHVFSSLDGAIDALTACGAVGPDDPRLAGLQAAAIAMGRQQPAQGRRPTLPEPWRSVAAGGSRTNGPRGDLRLFAAVPRIDGTSVEVTGLSSSGEQFALKVTSHGETGFHPFFRSFGERRLAWTALDDLGNQYLGSPGAGGGGGASREGTVDFSPALVPKAEWLEVSLTGSTRRAVFRIALDWRSLSKGARG